MHRFKQNEDIEVAHIEVQEIIKANSLTERHARMILKLRSKNQQLEILEHILKQNLDVWSAENYIKKILQVSRGLRNVKEFTSIVSQGIKTLKANGVNVGSKKVEKEGYTDLIVRLYK